MDLVCLSYNNYLYIYYIYIHNKYLYINLVNLGVHSSPFHLAEAQSRCLIVIGRDGSLSTLCHKCGVACQ